MYVPCSGLTGENLTKCCNEPLLREWYNGPTLLDRIGKKRINCAAGSKNFGTQITFGYRVLLSRTVSMESLMIPALRSTCFLIDDLFYFSKMATSR